MERISHGTFLLESNQPAPVQPVAPTHNVIACPEKTRFDYLFRNLPKNGNDYLSDKDATGAPMADTLIRLGNSMTDPDSDGDPHFDHPIPSAYTYFGQFITHEVVFEVTFKGRKLGPDTVPLSPEEIAKLKNARTTQMDLDSVYGPMLDNHDVCYLVPRKGDEMELGIAGNGDTFRGRDLKREFDPPYTALIGDRRNDSNLIISQLHLAFLRAHNFLITKHDKSFAEAQKLLRQHFQWLVVFDYLRWVADHEVLDEILGGKIDIFKPLDDRFFMPVEFSAAAFRFAHSMPRSHYDYNIDHRHVELTDLFLPIPRYSRIAEEWIIDWSRFVPGGPNFARPIDTRLVQPLFRLKDADGNPVVDSTLEKKMISLSSLDLLRGYLLHLPTGQAVARELEEPALSATEIQNAAERIAPDQVAATQKAILKESGLSECTPLWFYILAEAAVQKKGACLGRVGSKIVAGVLIELVRRSADSILTEQKWVPSLGNGTTFNLVDLFKLAELPT